tara:strand:- start:135 stop:2552 length:2418 start_codon:yes stop_codon:yes gene_type:complete
LANKNLGSDLKEKTNFEAFKSEVLNDFKVANISRAASLTGRKEVLTGKAKFGIFGDGKEIAQIALAKQFKNGDFRAGYYRDQTIAFATEIVTLEQWFAQLYANPDISLEPCSAGRQMNSHFATRSLDKNGDWKDLKEIKNFSSDISPTASQMPRALGLAMASKVYRQSKAIENNLFSNKGNEVAFATIGDASTSEGIFWETINAAGVMQVPLVVSVWDDGYGISVPKKYQTTKESISEILDGFSYKKGLGGVKIYKTKAWDYVDLIKTYEKAVSDTRKTHIPCVIHVEEATQPQGHSTSGSHERYKTKDRLEWEIEYDGITKMRAWIIDNAIATESELESIEEAAKKAVAEAKRSSWASFLSPIKSDIKDLLSLISAISISEPDLKSDLDRLHNGLSKALDPYRKEMMVCAREVLLLISGRKSMEIDALKSWKQNKDEEHKGLFNSYLYSNSEKSALKIEEIQAIYDEDAQSIPGYQILNKCFDYHLEHNPFLLAFGEDVGEIGDVNQGFAGLQNKHGVERVFDTGIREATIIGQGIGMAMRGLRPIAEIQYLDYLLYGLQQLSDDLSTLQYRTKGGQKAPLIIRTRGHRLEGIWHTGSPMSMILGSLRGIYILTPRNMTQAAGMYNTMLASDDPALIIECLNGYRLREKLPSNLIDFKVPIGKIEVLKEGADITVVTYGSNCRIAMDASSKLEKFGISCEVIDVQSLIPFDLDQDILASISKTNKVVFFDEDVSGGASAYMMQKVIEEQKAFEHLDIAPKTLCARDHRSAYGSDGDYFSKPSKEDLVELIYNMMNELNPSTYLL